MRVDLKYRIPIPSFEKFNKDEVWLQVFWRVPVLTSCTETHTVSGDRDGFI